MSLAKPFDLRHHRPVYVLRLATMHQTIDPITTWLNVAGKKPRLPKSQISKISNEIQELPEGDPRRTKLINKLVEHNLLLVANLVGRFLRTQAYKKWGHESTVDYFQVGVLGLRKAAEKFDPKRGYQFSTYASYWIRCYVGRHNYLEISPIYVPEDSIRAAFNYRDHKITGGRNFSEEKACEMTDRVLMAINFDSLDRLIGEDIDVADTIRDNGIDTFNQEQGLFSSEIEQFLKESDILESTARLLRHRFVHGMEYKQISAVTGLPISLIRSRCDHAIRRLRKVANPDKLAL